ncbi:MAG TPA: LysE family translocator [Gaiellaceae bacterium]|nr:LysE family translocator [Gaiellaceae bacterium]
MPSAHAFAIYIPAALILLAIPGPAVLYVVATSVEGGRRAGLLSVCGVHLGSLVHVAAACAGLSALIVSSAIAFSTVKYVGAAYLVYLGIRKWLEQDEAPVPGNGQARGMPVPARAPRSGRRVFGQGVVVNVLNPKTALFFLAFLPQFVDRGGTVWAQIGVLGLVWVALGLLSDGAYALAGGTIGGFIRRRRKTVRIVSGGIFVGLGAVAASS